MGFWSFFASEVQDPLGDGGRRAEDLLADGRERSSGLSSKGEARFTPAICGELRAGSLCAVGVMLSGRLGRIRWFGVDDIPVAVQDVLNAGVRCPGRV